MGFDCSASEGPCEAYRLPVRLGAMDDGMVVAITQRDRFLSRFIIFRNESVGWRVVGCVDAAITRYFDPTIRSTQIGGRWWLVLIDQTGSGTGYARTRQRWFQFRKGRVAEALSILDQAYLLVGPDVNTWRASAVVTGFSSSGSEDSFTVLYRSAFTLANTKAEDVGLIGTRQATAVYWRQNAKQAFRLNERAGLGKDEIANSFTPGPESDILQSDFLKLEARDLRRIASGPPRSRRNGCKPAFRSSHPARCTRSLL